MVYDILNAMLNTFNNAVWATCGAIAVVVLLLATIQMVEERRKAADLGWLVAAFLMALGVADLALGWWRITFR
jgi:hypothetical protein